jgi:hypothetical protein
MLNRATAFILTASALFGCASPAKCDDTVRDTPKDAELATLFRSHREAFERLATMGMEDRNATTYISIETLNQDPLTGGRETLSADRRNEYKRLLASIRPDIVMRMDFFSVSFSYWSGGAGVSIGKSWTKGLAYVPHGLGNLGRIVAGLDRPPTEDGVYFVPVEANWYIVYVQRD